MTEVLARVSKAAATARARAAGRAARAGEHKRLGFADPVQWLARQGGSTASQARAELAAAEALCSVPGVLEAAAVGEVSLAEVAEVARTERAVPGAGAGALDVARRAGLGPLREHSRRVVLGSLSAHELAARQHKARYLRHWVSSAGMTCIAGAFEPSVGTALVNRVQAHAARLRRTDRSPASPEVHQREPFEALAADALAEAVLSGGGGPSSPRAELCIVADFSALARGHTHEGEICHLPGSGPVPVARARELLARSVFVKAVVHDGRSITHVAHYGRHLPAELRTALELGRPPGFDGAACSAPGCGRRYGLEWDHVVPFSANGPTSYDNLQALCYHHHQQNTEADRRRGGATQAPSAASTQALPPGPGAGGNPHRGTGPSAREPSA